MSRSPEHFIAHAIGKLSDLRQAKQTFAQRLIHTPRTEHARRLQQMQLTALAAARRVSPPITPTPTENVVGVGIGEKISDGRQTGNLAVKFLVRMKYPLSQMDTKHALPRDIDGVVTDVEEVGTFQRFATAAAAARRKPAGMPNPRTRIRPAQPGSSVGFQDPAGAIVMAGTFGAVVKDKSGTYVLSNNHVLADENRLPIGSAIFQPGLLDGGNASTDQIASLTRFITLETTKPNAVDCAIAKASSASIVSSDVLHIGAPAGVAAAAIDMSVHKFGRTTGYTVGSITSIDTDVTVKYDIGNITFAGQIIIVGNGGTAFSQAGDSGSLILERGTNEAVALLFAGSATHTIANHLDDVLKALNVTLA